MVAGIWSATCPLPSLIDPPGARSLPTLSRPRDSSTRTRAASTRGASKSRPQKGLRLCYCRPRVCPDAWPKGPRCAEPAGIIPLRGAPAAAEPPLSRLPRRAGAGGRVPAAARASSSPRSPPPPTRTQALERPMAAVAEALARQQEARGRGRGGGAGRGRSPHPERPPIVTGQQAGLFGGPLFVLWKALDDGRRWRGGSRRSGAGRSCRCSGWPRTTTTSRRCAPTTLVDAAGALRDAALRPAPGAARAARPGTSCSTTRSAALVEELARALPAGPRPRRDASELAAAPAIGRARRSRRPSRGSSRACCPSSSCSTLRTRRSSALMVPVLARELARGLAHARGSPSRPARRLLAAGYHQQVPGAPGLPEPVRRSSRASGARSRLADGDGRGARHARALVRGRGAARSSSASPRAWSPGALLRPLAQDALLPTAAYVGGPAEIAYHAQIGPVLRALRDPAPGAAAAAEPDARRAAAGAGPRGRAADARRPRGRPRARS